MAAIWEFRCYLSDGETDEIRAWYNAQPKKVQGKFLSRVRTLGGLPLQEWTLPLFRWLHGECAGLGEIRFKVQVQHRPLGYRSSENSFTLVFCAHEKGDKFVPRNACEIGLRRKAEIEIDRRRSHACWTALD